MLPTRDQIEHAAYDRWIRRHRDHGYDRHDWIGAENELTYLLNYQVAAEYVLDSSNRPSLGGRAHCRFCERTPTRASFSLARPVVQGVPGTTLSRPRSATNATRIAAIRSRRTAKTSGRPFMPAAIRSMLYRGISSTCLHSSSRWSRAHY